MNATEMEALEAWCRRHDLDAGEVEARRLAWVDERWLCPLRVFAEVYNARGLDASAGAAMLEGADYLPGPGRVLADPLGRLLLTDSALADGSPADDLVARVGLWVVEGALLWLEAAIERPEADGDAPAILGLPHRSSWAPALASRIPSGSIVTIAASPEAERLIVATLAARMRTGDLSVARVNQSLRRAA